MLQAPSASSLYVTTSETPNYALVTTTSWSPSVSTVGIDASFDGQEGFGYLGHYLNAYPTDNKLVAVAGTSQDITDGFHVTGNGYLNRTRGLSFAQQDAESDYHWGYSSGPTASDVDGFVYSDDGLNW
ncbi:MAG: hypothetical protein ACXABD_22555, partial [Candidatus Thorarchaeota archaeon]